MNPPGSSAPPGDEDQIHLKTAAGDDFIVTRAYYRDNVLLPSIRGTTDPAQLAAQLSSGFEDGFGAVLVADAYRLTTIDPIPERSHCAYAQALIAANDLDRAAAVLDAYAQRNPPSPYVNSLRATIAGAKHDFALALRWQVSVIELAPDHPDSLRRLAACAKEVGGEDLLWQYVEWAANVPGCWRALHTWAERTLSEKGLDAARPLYARLAADPGPNGEGLIGVTAEMSQAGDPSGAIDLALAHYDPLRHLPDIAHNLFEAFVASGRLAEGEQFRQRLLALPQFNRASLEDWAPKFQSASS